MHEACAKLALPVSLFKIKPINIGKDKKFCENDPAANPDEPNPSSLEFVDDVGKQQSTVKTVLPNELKKNEVCQSHRLYGGYHLSMMRMIGMHRENSRLPRQQDLDAGKRIRARRHQKSIKVVQKCYFLY